MLASRSHLPPLRYACGLVSALFACGIGASVAAEASSAQVAEVQFNTDMLRGFGDAPVDISRFNRGNFAAPGDYTVPIVVNDRRVGRGTVRLRQLAGEAYPQPCVDTDLLTTAGVNVQRLDDAAQAQLQENSCVRLPGLIPDARAEFDNGEQHLYLSIPQIWLNRSARGYVDPDHWNEGITAGMLRYNANVYRYNSRHGSASTQGYLGLDSGFNVGAWRFRHRGNLSYQENLGTHYESIQTSVQRSLAPIKSQLTAGEFFTEGDVLESLNLRGVRLSSDDRMYPESLRGYAPTVHGIANSNARVSIRQNGIVIYETTVAPGEFQIDDLYPTGYGGDLEVVVTEADGSVHISRVPFSAPINALRAGATRYSLAAGQYRNTMGGETPYVFQGTVRHGFNNLVTGYGGITASEHYLAGEVGAALNTSWGAFSLDATYARARLRNQPDRRGQSYGLSYSRLYEPTATSVTLAAYRYSTDGFLNLADTVALRSADSLYALPRGYGSAKGRLQVMLNQPLGERWGSLYLSGYSQNYWGHSGRDTEYQAGYSNSFKRVNYNISASRQYSAYSGKWENTYMLNFSLPLGSGANAPRSNTTIQRNNRTRSTFIYETVNGSLGGSDSPLYYGVSASHSRHGGQGANSNNVSANASWTSPLAQLGASASRSSNSSQASASISGAAVAWGGGVALTPSLGDTFAIVDAQGAAGARIANMGGLRVNSRGYGVVSNLTPFAQNTIEVDPNGLPLNVQFKSTIQHVAPTAGAIVPVKFEVEAGGQAAVIRARQADGQALPFGAQALDGNGNQVGTVAQGSRIIASSLKDTKGRITIKWGATAAQQCTVDYALPEAAGKADQPFHLLQGTCVPTGL
ncbi:fimbria/pilus outer membrane usher protein [Bordetella petrii]|uniref:Outer membrane usher protein n=1 Tax=Bordetella petrii (strain ATCC BAA-461 / DSM 12804 / CCUG 43448 / CIP 107267 / Se-1111R) TaxID=340100 RepID=A9IDF0_BORPD|nr:fimbria/pilus outer membrane usher protein [Bordetella petrii]CAP44818.1 outer membrane usher protein [Bordetella petrii]